MWASEGDPRGPEVPKGVEEGVHALEAYEGSGEIEEAHIVTQMPQPTQDHHRHQTIPEAKARRCSKGKGRDPRELRSAPWPPAVPQRGPTPAKAAIPAASSPLGPIHATSRPLVTPATNY